MSKVEELLAKYNPNGVRFDEIGNNVISLPKEILKNEFIQQQGDYPVINSGRDIQGFYSKYNNDGDVLTVASRGESAGYIQYTAVPFWAGGLCYPYRTIDNKIVITKFLYYYLKKTEKTIMTNLVMRGGIPAINKVDFEKYEIPLPHIKVQEEIVEILDSFTNLIDALNEELSLRQKQFEYYRDKLISQNASKTKILNELSLNFDKKRIPITEKDRNKGEYPYYGASGIVDYIDDYIFDGKYLLISEDGNNLLARTQPIAFCAEGKFWVNNHAHILLFENDIVRKFVQIYINSIDLSPYITGGAQPKLNQKNLNLIQIPIPENNIESIVEKLDAFESLISSLKEEIALRQKQYEYYREKLLTFD